VPSHRVDVFVDDGIEDLSVQALQDGERLTVTFDVKGLVDQTRLRGSHRAGTLLKTPN
jgi:hypothetical protein